MAEHAHQTLFALGCGTGHATRIIASRGPAATARGRDDSPEMPAQGGRRLFVVAVV